jgi:hypothetical protein
MPRVGLSDSSEIQADVVEEGRLIGVAEAAGVPVRLLGGVAVRVRASGGLPSSLEREYKELRVARVAATCKGRRPREVVRDPRGGLMRPFDSTTHRGTVERWHR